LAMLGITGVTQEWFDRHPEWGNFPRSGWPSSNWINGTGPLSSALGGFAGWAELPFSSADFHVGPEQCKPEDDGICATQGGKNYPFFDLFNAYVPSALDTTIIWYPLTKADKCRFFKYSAAIIADIALIIKNPVYKAPLGVIAIICGNAALVYCP
jgi:hypothetical protein